MGGSPSHPSSSHPPTSLRGIEFQGQRAAFGSPGQWSPNTVFNSRWKLTPPFQVPSTAIVVSFSAHPLISSPAINSECYSHSLTSSSRSIYITYSQYGRIDSFLTSLGFTKSKADSNLYFKVMNDEPVILLLYVDDLFLTGEEKLITECKKKTRFRI
jgi:hypothetical protein